MENFWRFRTCCPFTKLVLSSSLYMLNLSICWSLNSEGAALLKFKEKLRGDPFGALSNWRDESGVENPCFWFGVECLDGHVVSLNLTNLCLRGSLSSELGELVYIKSLILRNNSFSGAVPEDILDLDELRVLDIGYNNFSGELRYDSSLPAIFMVDNNELLEERNPELYLHLKLYGSQVVKDLLSRSKATPSCIQLTISGWNSGNVTRAPQTPLQEPPSNRLARKFFLPPNFPAPDLSPVASPLHPDQSLSPDSPPSAAPTTSVSSPPLLAPTPTKGPHLPNNPSWKKHHYHHHHLVIIYSVAGGSLLLLLLAGLVFWQCGNVAAVRPWATGLSGQLQRAFITGVPKLGRAELEAACEDFSNVIGSNTSCSLYKGTLSNGTEIAVASIAVASAKDWSNSLESQFRNKIETLSRVNHKNFTSLLGYCAEDEPFTRMMVFEYTPNGTLFEHLHVREAEHLDWGTRLRVAMGIAYCLEHMHQLTPPITHKNVNTSAIYLTEDYAAKVSDFPFFGEAPSSGTEPNVSSNVYSFGLVLFEMMTGRLPCAAGSSSLEGWASDCITGTWPLREVIDPTLETYDENQLQRIGEVIRSCASTDPRRRPAMAEVCVRLREVTGIDPDGATPRLSPLWWAEVEIMTVDAS